jgi:hypothetical protein
MSSLADLDASKVVDIDLGSHAFKQNARAHLAEWAKRPLFLLARFPSARLADPDFVPTYGGAVGELRLEHLPLKIE